MPPLPPEIIIQILFGAGGVAFLVLAVLVIRRMAQRGLSGSRAEAELGEAQTEEDRALAEEALALPRPSAAPPERIGEGAEAEPTEPKDEAPPKELPTPLTEGLSKTRTGFMARINALLTGGRALDASLVDELEEVLVTSDVGVRTTERLLKGVREGLSRQELKDPSAVRDKLRAEVRAILDIERPPLPLGDAPSVVMVIGVNGVGKTTTIGKLASRLTRDSKSVVLAAADTFRAAAVEQLGIWAERAGAELVRGPDNGDPSSVVFDAIQHAKSHGADICLADTAGRLHTKVNLMEELKKVRRVMNKAHPGAPHEVLLVLDATTGQNAITQAKLFTEAVQVTSIALTKLDGTAKGGVVVAICDELKLPVRFIGIGEKVDDLRDFDSEEFVDALFAKDN